VKYTHEQLLADFRPVDALARERGEHAALQAKLQALCQYLRPLVSRCRATKQARLWVSKTEIEYDPRQVFNRHRMVDVAGPCFGYLSNVLLPEALRRLGVRVEIVHGATMVALHKRDWKLALIHTNDPDMHAAREANAAGDIDVDAGLVNSLM
jgi:hypothetical protein